jgi:tetratricopeptide (TPR) repeat protein
MCKFLSFDFESATEDFNSVINLFRIHRKSYFYRGMCNIQLEKYESALIDFSHLNRLNTRGNQESVYNSISQNLIRDLKEVISEDSKTFEISVNHLKGLTNRAVEKAKSGDYLGAIADLNKVIVLNPKDDGSRILLQQYESKLSND